MPTMIEDAGATGATPIGLYGAVPYAASIAAMISVSRDSDPHRERRRHLAFVLTLGVAGLVASAFAGRRMPPVFCALGIAAGEILTFDPKQING